MLKVNKKNNDIVIVGDSDTLKEEIGTLMLALCGEAAKKSKENALDFYNHYVEATSRVGVYLKLKYHIDTKTFLEEKLKEAEEESATLSKDLDNAIEQFFASLDEIIKKKKKGDK
jgi:hypothetical protein